MTCEINSNDRNAIIYSMKNKFLFALGYIQILYLISLIFLIPLLQFGFNIHRHIEMPNLGNDYFVIVFLSYLALFAVFYFYYLTANIILKNFKIVLNASKFYNKFTDDKKLQKKFIILGYINIIFLLQNIILPITLGRHLKDYLNIVDIIGTSFTLSSFLLFIFYFLTKKKV